MQEQENPVTTDKLAADLRLVISDAEALLRAAVGETTSVGRAKIQEGPWNAVGIAVLAGVALGLLIGRK